MKAVLHEGHGASVQQVRSRSLSLSPTLPSSRGDRHRGWFHSAGSNTVNVKLSILMQPLCTAIVSLPCTVWSSFAVLIPQHKSN